jgi:signal transduction histidine kinase
MIVLALAAMVIGCFAVGTIGSPWRTVGVPAVISAGVEIFGTSAFNPLYLMVTFGPWAAGAAVRSRRRLAFQLAEVGEQLEAGRVQYSSEQLRYERIRFARELHDTVAHWMTAVVLQAAAGQLLSAGEPERAAETFDHIADAARRATVDVERAVALMGSVDATEDESRSLVDEVVALGAAAGVQVHVTTFGDVELSIDVSLAMLRLVQEGITNALKHSPGASVEVRVRIGEHRLEVEVFNEAPVVARSDVVELGSGHGLAGLRDRVEESGGHFEAGATADGGWQLSASFAR